ncbi:T9SS type A sorting domain-containing protein [Tenacibaculum piscium]|nr:T9SS type A sorting domain-containing protein [Tenacibaculum piscium]
MIINNADNPTDKIDELIINPLDFSSEGDKKMAFDLSYTKFTNAYITDAEADAPDNLIVLVSKNCGLTWTEVYNKTHTELETVQVRDLEATPDDNEANDFIPSKASDWRKESIDLNAFTGNSSILIKFKNISGYGTRIWIDNLSITSEISNDDITWKGTTNNDWNEASNWSTNTLPTPTSRIVIPAGLSTYPTTSTDAVFNTLTIESGATFMAEANVTGTVTYKRNIENTDWYLIASPLKEETLENFITGGTLSFASGTRGNIGFAPFNNEHLTKAWDYQTINSTGNFEVAKGYSLKLATPSDISFTGKINTNDVNIEINNGARNNYNLVGNPFTTYINAVTFLNDNETTITEKTIWIWNGTTYEVYNEQNSLEIAPAQGFFVEATNPLPANSTVTFAKENQSHQNTDTFKREAPKTSFELFVEDGTRKKSTKVFYVNDKTTGFDNGSDSKLFGGVTSNFEVFTELVTDNKGNKLAIQTLPNTNIETIVVPVGLTTKEGKEVSISVSAKNLPTDVNIYLEDRIANTFTNISKTKIVVENNTKGAGQFYIHTTSKRPDVIVNKDLENVSIYKSDNNAITITGLQTENATLKVYSMLGKTVFDSSFKSTGVSVIQLPKTAKGVYIVELISILGKINKKIILE